MQDKDIISLVTQTLEDQKAQDMTSYDISHLTDIMDHMIIVTATSSRHAKTLAEKVVQACKAQGIMPLSIDDTDDGQWVLIDLNFLVVHVMLDEIRQYYSLEKLWSMTEASRQKSA